MCLRSVFFASLFLCGVVVWHALGESAECEHSDSWDVGLEEFLRAWCVGRD